MRSTKFFSLVLATALIGAVASPVDAKPKGPKPYKSDPGMILVPHTLLHSSTGEANSMTMREFESTCSVPASNGFDAYVFEVPKAYQKIMAMMKSHTEAQLAYDIYAFFYDKSCKLLSNLEAQGAVTEADVEGPMPAGTAFVVLADFAGDPATVSYELKPMKMPMPK